MAVPRPSIADFTVSERSAENHPRAVSKTLPTTPPAASSTAPLTMPGIAVTSVAALQPSLRISMGARSHGLGMPGSRSTSPGRGAALRSAAGAGLASARRAGTPTARTSVVKARAARPSRRVLRGAGRMAEVLWVLEQLSEDGWIVVAGPTCQPPEALRLVPVQGGVDDTTRRLARTVGGGPVVDNEQPDHRLRGVLGRGARIAGLSVRHDLIGEGRLEDPRQSRMTGLQV